jgi:glucose/arabinose dehydrogenase
VPANPRERARRPSLFPDQHKRDDLGATTPGDWLSLVRERQDWGFPGCYGQGGTLCAGVPRPTAVLDKHAAVGGVAIVTGQLGASVGTAAIVPEWNVAKVERVAVTRSGSNYRATVKPLLTGIAKPLGHRIRCGPVATRRRLGHGNDLSDQL